MGEVRRIIGENIKKVCSLKGIRQVDISEYMGVSQGSVSNWIKGTNSIDVENLAKLCRFLGVSLDQIFGFEPINPDISLSVDEKEVISLFRSLNNEGKRQAVNSLTLIAGNPDMKKEAQDMSAM